jgi:hypothetical protein
MLNIGHHLLRIYKYRVSKVRIVPPSESAIAFSMASSTLTLTEY